MNTTNLDGGDVVNEWDDRYGQFRIDDDVVIYDRDNEDAWIRSTGSRPLGDAR